MRTTQSNLCEFCCELLRAIVSNHEEEGWNEGAASLCQDISELLTALVNFKVSDVRMMTAPSDPNSSSVGQTPFPTFFSVISVSP
jgi:hypothetical protein